MSQELLAVVVIGRNEGDRLRRCLDSVLISERVTTVVYVDSGSADGSVEMAKSLGCVTFNLDMTKPFTAARARNEGFDLALKISSDFRYVQFVDGDCEIVEGWLESAVSWLQERPDVVAVCGRRRERYPDRSVFNRLCDFEWDTPVGEAKACGGDVMMRAEPFKATGGYRASLIAGEEPELCVRLRAAGWLIWRLDVEMTKHDANMMYFSQWWTRSKRTGYAFAEGSNLHGSSPERHWVRESRSVWFWGLFLPLSIVCLVIAISPWLLVFLSIYPIQILRMYFRESGSARKPMWYWTLLLLGKFPETLGQLSFIKNKVFGMSAKLIEYK